MGSMFPGYLKVSPAFTEPELVVTYAQATGAFAALAGGKPRVKIGPADLYVYINSLDLRTNAVAGQSNFNSLPSASLVPDFISTQTYSIGVRTIWDADDMAAAGNYNVPLPAAQDMAMRQGIFQQMRTGLLQGFSPANGEGLLNTANATLVTLPPDSYGETTLSTYDNGQMALFFLSQCVLLKSGMYQSGGDIKSEIVVISPQRVFLQLADASIVQVTSYQRPGAGTSTVGGVIKGVLAESGDTFTWYFDDTLKGQGAGGADAVILTIPEIEVPAMPGINTNEFGELKPSMRATNLMYMDMAAPRKIPTPTPDGAITEIQRLRTTSGWNIRPQAIFIISIPN